MVTPRGQDITTTRKIENVLRAIDRVAEQLNNTRAVCRKYYVHPAVFEGYAAGTMIETLQSGTSPAPKNRPRHGLLGGRPE